MIADLAHLFVNFFMTGLFSIGGGLATLPFLYDIADRTGWYTYEDIANMLAISESTPGAIGANMATYTGYHVASIPGAIVASVALATPGLIIILIVARILNVYRDNRHVEAAFHGLRPASVGLIAAAAVSVLQISLLNLSALGTGSFLGFFRWKAILLAAVLFLLTQKFKNIHPVAFLAGSALVGVLFSFGD